MGHHQALLSRFASNTEEDMAPELSAEADTPPPSDGSYSQVSGAGAKPGSQAGAGAGAARGGGGGRETGRGVAAVEPFALYQFRYSMEGWEMNVGGEVRERARRERQSTRGEKEGRENSARGDGLGL